MYWWRKSDLTKFDVTLLTDHENVYEELCSARKEAIVAGLRYRSVYIQSLGDLKIVSASRCKRWTFGNGKCCKDIGLCDISSIQSDIEVPVSSLLLTVTLCSSVRTTLVYNDAKYSGPFMTP
jgi:hypothetical protein